MASKTRAAKRKMEQEGGASGKKPKVLLVRSVIGERGFDLSSPEMAIFQAEVERRGWSKLCRVSKRAPLPLVRDFYGGTYKENRQIVKVRNGRVNIGPEALNNYFGLEAPPKDDLEELLNNPPAEDILRVLTKPGTEWVRSPQGDPRSLSGKSLLLIPRVWLRFVSANLMPGTNVSRVTMERAILVYCILTGRQIDIGKLLYQQFHKVLTSSTGALWFPSLIFSLCKKAQIEWSPQEELTRLPMPLDHTALAKMAKEEASDPVEQTGDPPPACASHSSIPTSSSVPWAALLQLMREQQKSLQNLTTLVCRVADHLGVEATPFLGEDVSPGTEPQMNEEDQGVEPEMQEADATFPTRPEDVGVDQDRSEKDEWATKIADEERLAAQAREAEELAAAARLAAQAEEERLAREAEEQERARIEEEEKQAALEAAQAAEEERVFLELLAQQEAAAAAAAKALAESAAKAAAATARKIAAAKLTAEKKQAAAKLTLQGQSSSSNQEQAPVHPTPIPPFAVANPSIAAATPGDLQGSAVSTPATVPPTQDPTVTLRSGNKVPLKVLTTAGGRQKALAHRSPSSKYMVQKKQVRVTRSQAKVVPPAAPVNVKIGDNSESNSDSSSKPSKSHISYSTEDSEPADYISHGSDDSAGSE